MHFFSFLTGISTNSGHAFTESKSINLSLSTLGKVIQSLSTDKPGHIPYRESKLTRILQASQSTLKYHSNKKFFVQIPQIKHKIPVSRGEREIKGELRLKMNKREGG